MPEPTGPVPPRTPLTFAPRSRMPSLAPGRPRGGDTSAMEGVQKLTPRVSEASDRTLSLMCSFLRITRMRGTCWPHHARTSHCCSATATVPSLKQWHPCRKWCHCYSALRTHGAEVLARASQSGTSDTTPVDKCARCVPVCRGCSQAQADSHRATARPAGIQHSPGGRRRCHQHPLAGLQGRAGGHVCLSSLV